MSLDPKDIILEAEQYGKAPTDIRISLTSAPVPDCAWMATREGWEPGSLYGLGRTPIVALADLLAREIELEDESGESFVPSYYCSCGAIHDGLEEFQRCKSCGKII